MSNYVFECKSGAYGFFKMDSGSDKCFIVINDGFMNSFNEYQDSLTRLRDYEAKFTSSLDWLTLTHPVGRLVSIALWHYSISNREVTKILENFSPGGFYVRSVRGYQYLPSDNSLDTYSFDSKLDEIRSYNSISNYLKVLFDYVEPEQANLSTYSNKIREFLIMACTEVEYLFKKFLNDNNYTGGQRLSTNDFIKILPHLKLKNYAVKLKQFPSLGVFKPFLSWDTLHPTTSLSWYDAYNAVKHDRGGNKNKGNLEMLINAIAAVHILLEAQYGEHIFDSPMRSKYESIFITDEYPKWDLAELAMPLLGTSTAWNHKLQITF